MSVVRSHVCPPAEEEERRRARAAVELLLSKYIVHHMPLNYNVLGRTSGDSHFFCDWCVRDVFMREMRSHGGLDVWSVSRDDLDARTEVGCWKVVLPCG